MGGRAVAKGILMSGVRAIALLALSLIVAVGGVFGVSAQDVVRLVPVPAYAPVYRLSPDGHTAAVFEMAAFHNNEPDADLLQIHVIDLDTGKARFTLTGFTDFASDVVFTPDGSRLVSYHQNGDMLIWDLSTGQQIDTIPALPGGIRMLLAPDGVTLVAVGSSGLLGQIMLWNLENHSITRVMMPRFDTYQGQMDVISDTFQAGHYGATAFALSPDSTQLAVASMSQDIWLWDLGTGESTLIRQGAQGADLRFGISQIAFTPDGSGLVYLDSATDTPGIYRLDLASGTETEIIKSDTMRIVGFTPDGASFAWVDEDSGVLNVARLDDPSQATAVPLNLPDNLDTRGARNLRSPQAGLMFSADGRQAVLGGLVAMDGADALLVIAMP